MSNPDCEDESWLVELEAAKAHRRRNPEPLEQRFDGLWLELSWALTPLTQMLAARQMNRKNALKVIWRLRKVLDEMESALKGDN